RDRNALFLAVAERHWQPVAPPFQEGAGLSVQLRILGEAVAAEAEARRARAVGALSFQLFALTHADMRARLHAENERIYQWAGATAAGVASATGWRASKRLVMTAPLPPERARTAS